MDSLTLIRDNLVKSHDRVLARVEDMRDHALVPPTPNGGGHTSWVLGHLSFVEGLVVARFARGRENPLASWESVFDGDEVGDDPADFPPFDDLLSTCRSTRRATLAFVDTLTEPDLDRRAAHVPEGWDDTFGTLRLCLQYVADHTYMHRGQLAAARRAAGLRRMWV